MLPLQTISRRIRLKVHDVDEVAYTDDEILDCINCGVRFIRRAIAAIRPSLLISVHEGILNAGTKTIELDTRPTKIVHVTAGDQIIKSERNYSSKKVWHNWEKVFGNHDPTHTETITNTYSEKALHRTELAHIVVKRNDTVGMPKEFCLVGEKTIRFFPTPERDVKYTALTIDDVKELSMADNSPLNTEFDDFLVEYAAIRLNVRNEFDMSQESAMMSNIYSQIQQILMPPPSGCVTKGYW